MKMKSYFLLLILFALSCSLPVEGSVEPVIDGQVQPGEWENAELYTIELNTGIEVNLSIIYTDVTVFYLASIDHSNEVNEINLDPSQPHDYFGIEFDNNKDSAIMGTRSSPDDTIMVNYEANIGADMFMHSYEAFYDSDFNGNNDVQGRAGTDGSFLFFEISRPLVTDDNLGYDLNLENGDIYQIMIAFWDDQPAHSANAGFNIREDNQQFITLVVNAELDLRGLQIFSALIFMLSIGFGYLMINQGFKEFLSNLKNRKIKV